MVKESFYGLIKALIMEILKIIILMVKGFIVGLMAKNMTENDLTIKCMDMGFIHEETAGFMKENILMI